MKHTPRSALEKMVRLTVLTALVSGLVFGAVVLSGCVTTLSPTAHPDCADDQERVRIGPRGKSPKYVCRNKVAR